MKETTNYPLPPLRRSAVVDCLAASYFLSGDVKKASSTINDELARNNGRLGHAASLMRLLIANKQFDKAIQLLEGNIKSGENTPFMKSESYELLALAHLKKGEDDEALKLIDKALAVLKDSAADQLRQECFDLKCRILRALGRADAAEVIEKSTGRKAEKLIPFDDLAPPYQTRVLYN